MREEVLVIACGALAREIDALKRLHGWHHLTMRCLDARLHNHPDRIPERLQQVLAENAGRYEHVFVAYADCGTAGAIDRVIAAAGAERLPGAHCYEFFAGAARFAELAAAEPGTFYLTDFLARNFDKLVLRPLKLDVHPQLRDVVFGNYRRLVYLSQRHDAGLLRSAESAAARLGLEFQHVHCGYGDLERGLLTVGSGQQHGQENTRLLA